MATVWSLRTGWYTALEEKPMRSKAANTPNIYTLSQTTIFTCY